MVNYDEYKQIVTSLMKSIFEAEKQRCVEVKELREELRELCKTGKISDAKRFTEILKELDILESIEDSYKLDEWDYSELDEDALNPLV